MDSSLAFLILLAGLLLVILFLVARISKPRLDKNYFYKNWQIIEVETHPMAALISADKLLDEALKRAGVKGATMGERLKKCRGLIKDLNGVWSAHKLRNQVVHETDKQLSNNDVSRALVQFKKALKDLGAL